MRVLAFVVAAGCWHGVQSDGTPVALPPPAVVHVAPDPAAVGQPGDAPMIAMDVAIARAQSWALDHHLDLRRHYLESASFDRVAREWVVTWQVPRAKGGTTWIHLHESGTTSASYGE